MASVEFVDDCIASVYENSFMITISPNGGQLSRKDVTSILRKLGYKLNRKWEKIMGGWEAKFYYKGH